MPDRPQIAGTPVPGADAAEQQKKEPTDIDLVMRNPRFEQWRRQTPEDVTITDYGRNRHTGRVVSEPGLKTRILPTTNSDEPFVRLNWGGTTSWRFQITVGEDVWIVLNEGLILPTIEEFPTGRFQVTSPVDTLDVDEAQTLIQRRAASFGFRVVEFFPERRHAEGIFAALRIGNETFIQAGVEPPDAITRNWP